MPTVQLSFTALPSHVRTARLVAAAVARRSGVDEALLDEVRLAVGEACSRAVDLHRRHCPEEPVRVTLVEDVGAFRVEVADRAPADSADGADVAAAFEGAGTLEEPEPLPASVGLAVISGLVDDMSADPVAGLGLVVRMRWPADSARSTT